MSILLITALIFLGTFGVTLSALYLMIEVPETRRKMRARLAAIEQTGGGYIEPEVRLATEELAARVPRYLRWAVEAPIIHRGQLYMEQAGLQMLVWIPVFATLLLGTIGYSVGIVLRFPIFIALAFAVILGVIPFSLVAIKRARRFRRFEEIFPEAMDMLARAVRAGYAATSAFSLIAEEMPAPVSHEFRTLYDQQNLGLPLWRALENFAARIPLADVRIFVTTMRIQQETGGNLAEVLDKLSQVVRERFRLLRQVQVFTAEGRMSMTILMALPPVMALLLYVGNPKYMESLFVDPLGRKMLGFALVSQFVGFLVIRKIIRIRV